jgi:hypothetical protein
MHFAVPLAQIPRVQPAHALQVRPQRLDERLGQHGDTILLSLAVADQDLPISEVHVLHPQPQAFEHAQTRAVEQARDQPFRALQLG